MVSANTIDDSEWIEVGCINNYAVFMAYLLMGVRGLGVLVLTWSTAVLLGGFVSDLPKTDFWSLTVITLVQTVGVFDFLLKEKLRDILSSVWGMFVAVFLSMFEVTDEDHDPSSTELLFMLLKFLLAQLSWLLQVLVLSIVLLCPLAVLYVLGMYISTAVSLWRLIVNAHGSDSKSENMKPALIVLYSLAMAQGLLFGYMAIYGCVSKARSLAKLVAKNYSLDVNIVCDYLDSTVIGCNKDSTFIRGRNLITYAMDLLMESKTSESYVSGVSIIGTILQSNESEWDQHVLIKQCFTGSPSINHMINKLLQTLGPRSPYSREIRAHAARIVAHVAGDIHLEQFPRGIQCISSLLDTFEDYSWVPMLYERHQRLPKTYERDWLLEKYERRRLVATPIQVGLVRVNQKKTPDTSENEQPGPVESEDSRFHGYKELVVQGLNILQKLAVDEDNSRVMSNTQGLYSKIMASLISNRAHSDHHDDWCSMAEESLELMSRLMAGPCETGTVKLRVEIASKIEAITSTLEGVLGCDKCRPTLQGQAAEMLLDLSVDTSCIMASESSCIIFISTLLDLSVWGMRRIPVDQRSLWEEAQSTSTGSYYNAPSICWMKKRSYIKDSACQKLESLLSVQGGDIVGHLSRATTTGAKISKYRMRATVTLERLYSNYTKDNDFLKTLKESLMTNVIPKVLSEILPNRPTESEKQNVSEANDNADLEKGCDVEDRDNGQRNTSASYQQNGELLQAIKLQEPLVRLCETVNNKLISEDADLVGQFDKIAAHICSVRGCPVNNFTALVKEARELLDKKKART